MRSSKPTSYPLQELLHSRRSTLNRISSSPSSSSSIGHSGGKRGKTKSKSRVSAALRTPFKYPQSEFSAMGLQRKKEERNVDASSGLFLSSTNKDDYDSRMQRNDREKQRRQDLFLKLQENLDLHRSKNRALRFTRSLDAASAKFDGRSEELDTLYHRLQQSTKHLSVPSSQSLKGSLQLLGTVAAQSPCAPLFVSLLNELVASAYYIPGREGGDEMNNDFSMLPPEQAIALENDREHQMNHDEISMLEKHGGAKYPLRAVFNALVRGDAHWTLDDVQERFDSDEPVVSPMYHHAQKLRMKHTFLVDKIALYTKRFDHLEHHEGKNAYVLNSIVGSWQRIAKFNAFYQWRRNVLALKSERVKLSFYFYNLNFYQQRAKFKRMFKNWKMRANRNRLDEIRPDVEATRKHHKLVTSQYFETSKEIEDELIRLDSIKQCSNHYAELNRERQGNIMEEIKQIDDAAGLSFNVLADHNLRLINTLVLCMVEEVKLWSDPSHLANPYVLAVEAENMFNKTVENSTSQESSPTEEASHSELSTCISEMSEERILLCWVNYHLTQGFKKAMRRQDPSDTKKESQHEYNTHDELDESGAGCAAGRNRPVAENFGSDFADGKNLLFLLAEIVPSEILRQEALEATRQFVPKVVPDKLIGKGSLDAKSSGAQDAVLTADEAKHVYGPDFVSHYRVVKSLQIISHMNNPDGYPLRDSSHEHGSFSFVIKQGDFGKEPAATIMKPEWILSGAYPSLMCVLIGQLFVKYYAIESLVNSDVLMDRLEQIRSERYEMYGQLSRLLHVRQQQIQQVKQKKEAVSKAKIDIDGILKVFLSERHEREKEKVLKDALDNMSESQYQTRTQEAEAHAAERMNEDRDAYIGNAEIYMDLNEQRHDAESVESLRVISARMHGKVVRYVESFCEQFIPLQAQINTLVEAAKARSSMMGAVRKRIQRHCSILIGAMADGHPLVCFDGKNTSAESEFRAEIQRTAISRLLSALHGSEMMNASRTHKKSADSLPKRGLSLLPAFKEEDEDAGVIVTNDSKHEESAVSSQFNQMEANLEYIIDLLVSYRIELEAVYTAYTYEVDESLADVPGSVRIGPLLISEGLPLPSFVKLVSHISPLLSSNPKLTENVIGTIFYYAFSGAVLPQPSAAFESLVALKPRKLRRESTLELSDESDQNHELSLQQFLVALIYLSRYWRNESSDLVQSVRFLIEHGVLRYCRRERFDLCRTQLLNQVYRPGMIDLMAQHRMKLRKVFAEFAVKPAKPERKKVSADNELGLMDAPKLITLAGFLGCLRSTGLMAQGEKSVLGTVLGAETKTDQVHSAIRMAVGSLGSVNQNIGGKKATFVVFKPFKEVDAIRIFQQARRTAMDKHNPHVVTLAMSPEVTATNKLGPRRQFEMGYEGFLEALVALCVIRYPDPFKTLEDRFDRFIRIDFLPPILKAIKMRQLQRQQNKADQARKKKETTGVAVDASEIMRAAQAEMKHMEKPDELPEKPVEDKEYGISLVADIISKSQQV